MIKKIGFTLAEVLIALVIIGVISAITIPSVMQTTQRQENVNKLKKAYSTLQQASYRIAIDNGLSYGDYSLMKDNDFFYSLSKNLNVMKICKGSGTECYPNTSFYRLDNVKEANPITHALITGDGVAYGWNTNYCSDEGLSAEDLKNCLGRFVVDINGDRKPNKAGIDIFFFAVVNNKGVVPAGSGNNSADCKKGHRGVTCAARVIKEGKISYI